MASSPSYRLALRTGRAAGALACRLGVRRAVVRENLRLAFGECDEALVRAIYRHFAAAAVDLLFFEKLFDPARLEEHFELVGGALEHYREEKPKAAIFVTGHFGNWELFGAAFRHLGIPLAPVVRSPAAGWLARRAARFRRAAGQETIPKDHALPLALKALKGGRNVAFLMDQAAGRHGIPSPFFGRLVQTFLAPAALALKLDVPIYAGYSTRTGDGIRYRCWAERVPVEGDVESLTHRLNRLLEGYVRACPEQWWWLHRRFKPTRAACAGRRVSPAGVPLDEGS